MRLPVGVGDQRQAAIVPRNLPQNGKDEEQYLQQKRTEVSGHGHIITESLSLSSVAH